MVVPELSRELHVWTDKHKLFDQLTGLDVQLGELYKNLDSSASVKPDFSNLRTAMQEVIYEMDMSYGLLGSLFRSGSRQTFFSSQVVRYADLYAASVLNLLHYPFSYMFRAPAMLMPHESTVAHEQTIETEAKTKNEEIIAKRNQFMSQRAESRVPHLFPEAPNRETQTHELDDEPDEETSSSSN